jgi:hypothetical protein
MGIFGGGRRSEELRQRQLDQLAEHLSRIEIAASDLKVTLTSQQEHFGEVHRRLDLLGEHVASSMQGVADQLLHLPTHAPPPEPAAPAKTGPQRVRPGPRRPLS